MASEGSAVSDELSFLPTAIATRNLGAPLVRSAECASPADSSGGVPRPARSLASSRLLFSIT